MVVCCELVRITGVVQGRVNRGNGHCQIQKRHPTPGPHMQEADHAADGARVEVEVVVGVRDGVQHLIGFGAVSLAGQ